MANMVGRGSTTGDVTHNTDIGEGSNRQDRKRWRATRAATKRVAKTREKRLWQDDAQIIDFD